ncbi:MAG: Protein translocase subunit SecE [Elusimicrobia bacterium]|nr:Protein translocase subunit SecE [Elusimicrobiota bacterium]
MQNLISFFKESWAELKQVAWLTTPQMIASTWMVVLLVIVMAIYVGGVDFILSRIIGVLV